MTDADGRRAGAVFGYDLILLGEAKRAANRASQAAERGKPGLEGGAAASAILCAAAACEALLSEEVASHERPFWGNAPDFVEEVRSIRSPLDSWKALLRVMAPNQDLPGSEAYQQLDCLFKVRNHIAHRSARILPYGTWPKKLEDCIEQGRIPVREAEGVDWTSAIFVHEVAQWAYDVAIEWLRVTAPYLQNARMVRGALGLDPLLEEDEGEASAGG